MTERYGYGYRYRDEPGGGERPSGRGAVAERRAGQDEEVREIDLTDEAAATIAPMILEYLRARYLKESHAEAHGHDADHAHDGVVRIQLERRPPWVDLEEVERDDWFVDEDEEAST